MSEYGLPEHLERTRRKHAAIRGLTMADLGPLADLLAAGDPIDDHLRFRLWTLIVGDVQGSGGLRLSIGKHPDLARMSQGGYARARSELREKEVALFMAERGAFDGKRKAAVFDTMTKYSLSRARVEQIWAAHKDDARQALAARAEREKRAALIVRQFE